MKNKRGITLIALIITIIVMLILVAVTINVAINGGLFNRATEASFRTEMQSIREIVAIANVNKMIGTTNDDTIATKVPTSDASKWSETLKTEIINWGDYPSDVNEFTSKYIKNNFINIVGNNDGYVPNFYYVKNSSIAEKKYVYSEDLDIVFKVNSTFVNGYSVHSLEELEHLQNGGERETRSSEISYTKMNYMSEIVTVGDIKYYEPNLTGLGKETTSLVFYKQSGETVSEDPEDEYPITAEEWLSQDRPSSIEIGNDTYILYDYANGIWANIRIVSSSVETNWTWIPRYSYSNSGTTTTAVFIDTNNNILNGEIGDFTVAPAFEGNTKQGIWVSKYEPTAVASTNTTSYTYYIPDVSGLDLENTSAEIYADDGMSFVDSIKLSTITNLNKFAKSNNWFDYYNQKWANIKIEKNGAETWWVWIPRYIYRNTGTSTDIIFVGLDDNPLDGSEKPSGYNLAPAFEANDGKKGIWVSKYEPTSSN